MTVAYEPAPLGYGVNRQKHQRAELTPPKPLPLYVRYPLAAALTLSFALLALVGLLKVVANF